MFHQKLLFALAATASLWFALPQPLAAADVPAGASLVDDCEGGTNQNKFFGFWYVYDDAKDGKFSTITNAPKDASGDYQVSPVTGEGNNGSAAIRMDYSLGKPTGTISYTYVGAGTELAPTGSTLDLTGATKISFYIKANPPVSNVDFMVCMSEDKITDHAYHFAPIPSVGNTWTKYEVTLIEGAGIDQPAGWGKKVAFDPSIITKLQWQINEQGVTPPATGTLWIDDIVIHSFTFKYTPPEACESCLKPSGSGAGALLSDLNEVPFNRNNVGFYWYCYNDVGTRSVTSQTQFSDIISGASIDETDIATPPLIEIGPNGVGGTNGAMIEFELGPTFTEGANVIKPFVGIGTSLSDANETVFYNATQDNATGIYFDYKLSGDVPFLRFEVVGNQNYANAGIVHHRLLSNTGGEWKGAQVLFSELMLPNWKEVQEMAPALKILNKAQLKKLQWAVQGDPGQSGTLAIDNVYFVGASAITAPDAPVIFSRARANMTGLSTSLAANKLHVAVGVGGIASASLVSMRGAIIATTAGSGNASSIDIPLNRVNTGLYLLKVKSTISASETVVPVSIVR